jgi:hypothetical protein
MARTFWVLPKDKSIEPFTVKGDSLVAQDGCILVKRRTESAEKYAQIACVIQGEAIGVFETPPAQVRKSITESLGDLEIPFSSYLAKNTNLRPEAAAKAAIGLIETARQHWSI